MKNFMNATVLGSGIMGAGIAAMLACAGIPVNLLDIVPEDTTDSNILAKNAVSRAVKANMLYDSSLAKLIKPGNFEDDLSCIGQSDIIIEAVVEDILIKQDIYKKIEKYINSSAVICSNTSGLSVNSISDALPEELKKRFLGVHFFNPPRHMKLVELIPCKYTAPDILERVKSFVTLRLGKIAVEAKDTPNFIANRIGTYTTTLILNSAEKYNFSFHEIDSMTGAFAGMSPSATCRTLDLVGLDTYKLICKALAKALPEEKENFNFPASIQSLIDNGNLGNKTGQGCFKYIKEEKKLLMWNITEQEYIACTGLDLTWQNSVLKTDNAGQRILKARASKTAEGNFIWEIILKMLHYAALNSKTICDDFRKIDTAMRYGYNYGLGPFELWDQLGALKICEEIKLSGLELPSWISKHLADNDGRFYKENLHECLIPGALRIDSEENSVIESTKHVRLVDINDGVALLQFISKSNALNSEMVEDITEILKTVPQKFDALVIGGNSKNFCVGADINEVNTWAQNGDTAKIEKSVKAFQKMMMSVKYLGIPVVAAPYGQTLGGGCEICLHSYAVLAQAETYMGLVEAGVGLVPAGGGLKEMALRIYEWSQYINGANNISLLKKTWENAALGKVSSSAFNALAMGYMRVSDRINMNGMLHIKEAKELALSLKSSYRPPITRAFPVSGITGFSALKVQSDCLKEGGWASGHDTYIAEKIAYILCGGNVPSGTLVDEQHLLDLECEAFVNLAVMPKTQERIVHMLQNGKPLRN